MPRAFVTGITGQDGSYLAELLLTKGYQVHGLVRRASMPNTGRIDHIADQLTLHHGDLSDSSVINRLLQEINPNEIYHLGAQSHVRLSFDIPEYTADVDAMGTLRLLEAARGMLVPPKIYNAASSELFGRVLEAQQRETTPFCPQSPYGIAKQFSYWTARMYREAYGLFVCNGILFNHESPRRGLTFVTRKICRAAAEIYCGKRDTLVLGNLDARRDWGYAPEYVEAMWLMMQYGNPEDFVIATGETHSVRELLTEAFLYIGMDWMPYVVVDPRYFRPTEVDVLLGDPSKAKRLLKWEAKTKFKELVHIMMEAELNDAR